jgi:hypothetical protein
MKQYPSLKDKTLFSVVEMLQYISREREIDVRDWNNLNSTFILGRKVARIAPTGSADILPTDRVGDILFADDYVYYVYNNAGTAEWRRIAAEIW